MVSALLGLVILSITGAAQLEAKRVEQKIASGRLAGDLHNLVKDGLNTYLKENYTALQANLPVSKTIAGVPVTIAPGTTEGQSFAPRVEDLVALGYLRAGTSNTAHLGGTYRTRLERQPAGCAAIPATCNLVGELYIDRPVLTPGTVEMDALVVGAFMERAGGDVLVSLNTSPASLLAMGGGTSPNPVPGTPAGVVGSRVGFGSSGFGIFLTLNDPRDPNFLGNVTVAGNIVSTNGNITAPNGNVGAGTGNNGGTTCRRAELEAAGAISLRSATCALMAGFRFIIGGETEAFADNFRNNAGTAGIRSNGQVYGTTATFTGNMTAGSVTSNGPMQVNGAATITGAVTGGSFANTAGTAGIRPDGTVYGLIGDFGSIVINNSATPGQACAPANAAVWGNVGGADILMRCVGGVWAPATGSQTGSVGGACPVNGATGTTASGVSLICSNGTWISTTDRMGKWVVMASYSVGNGTSVDKPSCTGGGQAAIYAIPQKVDSQWLFTNFYADSISTSQWRVNIVNGQTPATGLPEARALAQTGCWFL